MFSVKESKISSLCFVPPNTWNKISLSEINFRSFDTKHRKLPAVTIIQVLKTDLGLGENIWPPILWECPVCILRRPYHVPLVRGASSDLLSYTWFKDVEQDRTLLHRIDDECHQAEPAFS